MRDPLTRSLRHLSSFVSEDELKAIWLSLFQKAQAAESWEAQENAIFRANAERIAESARSEE